MSYEGRKEGKGALDRRILSRSYTSIFLYATILLHCVRTHVLFQIRNSEQPPFRLENHTLYPLNCQQKDVEGSGGRVIQLLPYNTAAYAWDDVDRRDRRLLIQTAKDDSKRGIKIGELIGELKLDKLPPNSVIKEVVHDRFAGEIIADGPTRVVRITDSGLPSLTKWGEGSAGVNGDRDGATVRGGRGSFELDINLKFGIGLSVVDAQPQELLYLKLGGVKCRRVQTKEGNDAGELRVKSIAIDNQLWITPFPSMLRIGACDGADESSMTENALIVDWSRSNKFRNQGTSSVSLVKKLAVKVQPIELNVDGNLIMRLLSMARAIKGDVVISKGRGRDEQLMKVLALAPERTGRGKSHRRKSSRKELSASDGTKPLYITSTEASRIFQRKGESSVLTKNSSLLIRDDRFGSQNSLIFSPEEEETGAEAAAVAAKDKINWLTAQRKVYFESLEVAPISVKFSFTLPPSTMSLSGGKTSSTAIAILSLTNISSISGAEFYWAQYDKAHVYGTRGEHLDSLLSSYVAGSLRQAHVLLLGSELFGNPMKLIGAFYDGVVHAHTEIVDGFREGRIFGAFSGGVKVSIIAAGGTRGGAFFAAVIFAINFSPASNLTRYECNNTAQQQGITGLCRTVSKAWLTGVSVSLAKIAESIVTTSGDFIVTRVADGDRMQVRCSCNLQA